MGIRILTLSVFCLSLFGQTTWNFATQWPAWDGFERPDNTSTWSSTYWTVVRGGGQGIINHGGTGRNSFPVVAGRTYTTGLSANQVAWMGVMGDAALALRIDTNADAAYTCRTGVSSTTIRKMTLSTGSETTLSTTATAAASSDVVKFTASGSSLTCTLYDNTGATKATTSATDSSITAAGTIGWVSYAYPNGVYWWGGGNLADCDMTTAMIPAQRTDYYTAGYASPCGLGTFASPFNPLVAISRYELIAGPGNGRTIWNLDPAQTTTIATPNSYWLQDLNILAPSTAFFDLVPANGITSSTNTLSWKPYPGRSLVAVITTPAANMLTGNHSAFGMTNQWGRLIDARVVFPSPEKVHELPGSNPINRYSNPMSFDHSNNVVAGLIADYGGDSMSNQGVSIEGNRIYHNIFRFPGYTSPDRYHGSFSYNRNNNSANPLIMKGNLGLYASYRGWRFTSGNGFGYDISYNTAFGGNSQLIMANDPGNETDWTLTNNMFGSQVSFGQDVQRLTVTNNFWYNDLSIGLAGATNGINNVTFNDNKVVGSLYRFLPKTGTSPTITADRNTFYSSGTNNYRYGTTTMNFASWQGLGFDAAGSFVNSANPSQNFVLLTPEDPYEPRRAHLSVINYTGATNHALDLSTIGFSVGDQYEIHDGWCLSAGAFMTGTYAGGTINVPLNRTCMDDPSAGDPRYYNVCWTTDCLSCTAASGSPNNLGWQSGTADPTGSCTAGITGSSIYMRTDTKELWYCAGGSWALSEGLRQSCQEHGPTAAGRPTNQHAFLIRSRQLYRGDTTIGIPFVSGASTATVKWGLSSAGPFDFGPAVTVSTPGPGPVNASIPQPVGAAYYTITYSNGIVTPALKAFSR